MATDRLAVFAAATAGRVVLLVCSIVGFQQTSDGISTPFAEICFGFRKRRGRRWVTQIKPATAGCYSSPSS